MQHEKKIVKRTSKSYKTKNGMKESVSKRVDLGVNSIFDVGDAVVIISADNYDILSADNDEIKALNERINECNAVINDKDKVIESYKITIADNESDISKNDIIISELTSSKNDLEKSVADKDAVIDDLNITIAGLNDKIDEVKALLLDKDAVIDDYKIKLAEYDAIDIDKITKKADELDNSKNAIILLQNQIREYIQLVNYHKERASAYKHQNVINKMIGRDATKDIIIPTLNLIDESGNPIADDNDLSDSADHDESSGDNVKLI